MAGRPGFELPTYTYSVPGSRLRSSNGANCEHALSRQNADSNNDNFSVDNL